MARPDVSTTTTTSDINVRHRTGRVFNALDWIATVLLIIGGLNWGLVGLFGIDLVATLFGLGSLLSIVVYILVGLAALYGLYMMTKMGRANT